jgi:hypothetical protein
MTICLTVPIAPCSRVRTVGAIALLCASFALLPLPARAGADFIGGQANAEAEDGPEGGEDGAFSERARAMQTWLQGREEQRREMGVAHVYERPRAIEDHFDRPRHSHAERRNLRSGKASAHGRKGIRSGGRHASSRSVSHSTGHGKLQRDRSGTGAKAGARTTGKARPAPAAKARSGKAAGPAKASPGKRRAKR